MSTTVKWDGFAKDFVKLQEKMLGPVPDRRKNLAESCSHIDFSSKWVGDSSHGWEGDDMVA